MIYICGPIGDKVGKHGGRSKGLGGSMYKNEDT